MPIRINEKKINTYIQYCEISEYQKDTEDPKNF